MDSVGETQEERQGKMLLHTEYSLLSLLHNQDGVVHHHGLFQVHHVFVIVSPVESLKQPVVKEAVLFNI